MADYEAVSRFEHLFWLQIMKEHSEFLSLAIPCEARSLRQQADHLADELDRLLLTARSMQGSQDSRWATFAFEAQSTVENLGTFKLNLLAMMLRREIVLDLTPTFVNHMVNELEDYLTILHFLSKGQTPLAKSPVPLHLLWLKDGEGHARHIAYNLDYTNSELIHEAQSFADVFLRHFSEATEYRGFSRTCLDHYPSLQRFNLLAAENMQDFCDYLESLRDLLGNASALGSLRVAIIDHMLREACYYLRKLHHADPTVPEPKCDPTRPSVVEAQSYASGPAMAQ